MRLWDDILGWPPAAVTGAWLAVNLAFVILTVWGEPAQFSGAFWSLTIGPPSIGYLVIPLIGIWYYALYRAALIRTPAAARRRSQVFLIALITYGACILGAAVLYYQRDNPPTLLLTVVSLSLFAAVFSMFASIWTASAALTRLEQHGMPQRLHSTLGTFILAAYLPIGIWFMNKRIKDMLSQESDASEMRL